MTTIPEASMTAAALFDRAGRALFGEQYVAPLAALLGVEKNTVGKWRDGKSRVPTGVLSTIERALLDRQPAISEAAFMVRQQLDAQRDQEARASRSPTVVWRNPNNITIELSRDIRPDEFAAFRDSFNAFTDGLGQRRGIATCNGRRMQGVLRSNLEGDQVRSFRDWFTAECDRIERES